VLTGGGIRCSRLFGEVGHYALVRHDLSNALEREFKTGPGPLRRQATPGNDKAPWTWLRAAAVRGGRLGRRRPCWSA